MGTLLILELGVRVVVILLSLVALWVLWRAKRLRSKQWTKKMYDIWLCHFWFVLATMTANIEFLYRKVPPSFSIVLIILTLVWSIKGAYSDESYTR